MNITEAIRARRNGASLDEVLGGLTDGRRVRYTARQRAAILLREAEDNNGGGGSLTGPAKDQILKVADKEGPKVAAAVMADVYDELPDDVKAAFDAIQGNGAGAAPPMDFGGGGGLDDLDDTGAEDTAEPDEGATSGPDALEGAGLGDDDLAGGAETVESLKRRLRAAQVIGESLLRRARRFKAERDHFQRQLGLQESQSNLDFMCESGYAYDVHSQCCVRINERVEGLVNEMMDPIDTPNSSGGREDKEQGVDYGFPVDADPGMDDPISGNRAATGGQSSSKFTRGGADPVGFAGQGSVSGGGMGLVADSVIIPEMAGPAAHTYADFNDDVDTDPEAPGDAGSVPGGATGPLATTGQTNVGMAWDAQAGKAVPTTNHPTRESVEEQRLRALAHQHNPAYARLMNEATDPLGRPLEENVHRARRADRQISRNRRHGGPLREAQARVAMVAEVFARYGVPAGKTRKLAEMYMDGDPAQRASVMKHAALDVPSDYAGQMASDVSVASGCAPAPAPAMPAGPGMMAPGAGGMIASLPTYDGDTPMPDETDEA